MKRRTPELSGSGLPAELAAGPLLSVWLPRDVPVDADRARAAALDAWHRAGAGWSLANGHGYGGWLGLLAPELRYSEGDAMRDRLRDREVS